MTHETCMRAKIVAYYFLSVEILHEKIGPIITSTTEYLVSSDGALYYMPCTLKYN